MSVYLLLIDHRLAAGVSYTWDEGPDALNKYPAPWVGVRKVGDEVKVCDLSLSILQTNQHPLSLGRSRALPLLRLLPLYHGKLHAGNACGGTRFVEFLARLICWGDATFLVLC